MIQLDINEVVIFMEYIIVEVVWGVCLVQDVGIVFEEIENVFMFLVELIQNIFNVV